MARGGSSFRPADRRALRSRGRLRHERQQRHFRWARHANGHVHRADAAADEHARVTHGGGTRHHGKLSRRHGSDDGKNDLPTVRVSGEDERDVQGCGFDEPAWIVCQEDDGVGGTTYDSRNVGGTLGPIADPDEINTLPADVPLRTRVAQHLDAVPLEGGGHFAIVVVVAQHGEYAVRRTQFAECFGGRADVASIAPSDVVPTEHDQVGLFSDEGVGRLAHIVMRDPLASMNIGQQADSES